MQVERTSRHPVPGPERVVAKHEVHALHLQLEVAVHACEAGQACRLGTVVVAGDQVHLAVQGCEEAAHRRRRPAHREIAEMPDLVGGTDALVPTLNHRCVHVVDRSEGAAKQSERAAVPKVRIRREEDRHASVDPTCARRSSGARVDGFPELPECRITPVTEIEEGSTGGARIASHRQRARAALPGRRRAAGRRRAGAGRSRHRGWPDRRPAAGGRRRAGARPEHHRSGRRRGLAGPGRPAHPSRQGPHLAARREPGWHLRSRDGGGARRQARELVRRRRARPLLLRAALRVRARHGRDPHPSRKPAAA